MVEEDEQRTPQTSDESALRSISLVPEEDEGNAPAPHFEVVATENACNDIMRQARHVSIGWQPGRRPEWSATLLDAAGHMLPDKYRVYQAEESAASSAKASFDDYLLDATLSAFALTPEEIGIIEPSSSNRAAKASRECFANEINERARAVEESLAAQIQRYIDEDPVIQETLEIVAETSRVLAEVNAALIPIDLEWLIAQLNAPGHADPDFFWVSPEDHRRIRKALHRALKFGSRYRALLRQRKRIRRKRRAIARRRRKGLAS